MDHLYSHVVLYMPQNQPYIALEPVTNANDGFNLLAQGEVDHGVFVLAPGCSREAMSGYVVGK
jgi:aldose 1-epimerase